LIGNLLTGDSVHLKHVKLNMTASQAHNCTSKNTKKYIPRVLHRP